MDLVSHALLGALVAQSISRSRNLRVATLVGGIAALLPDVDVLIQSRADPLLVLEYHRHFTHSIFFAPLASLLATIVAAPLVRHDITRPRLFFMVLLAYLSACLLDVCTSYGTHLLWPVVEGPMSLGIIAVVDPIFTLILLVAVMAAWVGRNRQRAWLGILFAMGYLGLGWLQHQRAAGAAIALANDRQLATLSVEVKPTIGNLLLWRSVAVTRDQQIQVDALHLGFRTKVYPGERRELLDLDTLLLDKNSRAYRDLLRYQSLNQPLLIIHSADNWMIGDARYAMLPTSADPLWGLQLNPDQPNQSLKLVTHRQLTPAMRNRFIDMLLGRKNSEPVENAE
jgi:inner membrane protein